MLKSTLRALPAVVFACGLAACSSDKKSDEAPKPAPPTNTLNPSDFHTKAATGAEIFNDLKSVRGKFGASSARMALDSLAFAVANPAAAGDVDVSSPGCQKDGEPTVITVSGTRVTYQDYNCKVQQNGRLADCTVNVGLDDAGKEVGRSQACTSSETTPGGGTQPGQPDQGTPDAQAFLPKADAVTDCASAFDLFTSLFAQAQAEYTDLTTELKNAAAQSGEGFQLTQASPAADETVAYELAPKDGAPGFSVTGRIAGGGTDAGLTLKRRVDMTIDAAKMQLPMEGMPAGLDLGIQKVSMDDSTQLDLAARRIVSTVNMTMNQTQGGQTSAQAVLGTIEVSDGADKYVKQDLQVSLGTAAAQAFRTNLTARLVDANTLTISGTFAGEGKPGAVNYTVTRNAAGVCGVAKN